MNIDKKALIGIITEIEASRERAKAETRHQSEILKQAKEKQFDTKAIRKVLQRRAMSAGDRDSLDLAVDTYERAMGSLATAQEAVESGRMSAREAAEHYGVPRGALAVVTAGSKTGFSSHPDHDADGTETGGKDADQGRAAAGETGGRDRDDARQPAEAGQGVLSGRPAGADEGGEGSAESGLVQPVVCANGEDDEADQRGGEPADEAPATPSVGAVAAEPRVASSSDDDDLDIPAHLRGPSPANRRVA